MGSLNRVPALIGWGKGGNVTSAGWQVTLCDPILHVSSRSDEACCITAIRVLLQLHLKGDSLADTGGSAFHEGVTGKFSGSHLTKLLTYA